MLTRTTREEKRLRKGWPRNPFIIMEQVKGTTLGTVLGARSAARKKSAKGERSSLHHDWPSRHALHKRFSIYTRRSVHRDVKPANIFIPENSATGAQPLAKLGDFGIMKWGDFQASISTGTLTVTSQQGLGTLKYMSPEQAIPRGKLQFVVTYIPSA